MPSKAHIVFALEASKEFRWAKEQLLDHWKHGEMSTHDYNNYMDDLHNGFFPSGLFYPNSPGERSRREAALLTLKWRNPARYRWIMKRRKYAEANQTIIGALSRYRRTQPKIYHQILDRMQKANPKKYQWVMNGIRMMDIKARYEWLKNK